MNTDKQKIFRVTTIPDSLKVLLKGQLKFMNSYYEIVGISGDGDAMEYLRKHEGIRTEVVEMTRTISPIKDLIATYKLFKLIKKEKPLIVHTHTPKAGIVGMLAAKLAGVKHRFHTVAGMPLLVATGPKRTLLNFVEKATYKMATKVFPNSFGLKEVIINERFTVENKLKVIGKGSSNGVNIEHFNSGLYTKTQNNELKKSLNIAENDFVFCFVGRLVTDKGINELVKAFNTISEKQPDAKLVLVGWRETELDPLLPETESLLKSNKNIIHVGYQSDVRPYFAISKVLVFPSYREGFPNVVLQAGSMNVPCIVSDINGCNEIIRHRENGLIISTHNVEAIIDAMCHLKENPEIHRIMSANSRKIIANNYQHTYIWNQLLIEYQKAN